MKMETENKELEAIKRGIAVNRFILVFVMILLIGIFAAGGFAFLKVKSLVTQIEPVVNSVSNWDVEGIYNTFNDIGEVTSSEEFDELINGLSNIDFKAFEAFNEIDPETIEGLKDVADALSKTDPEKLTNTINEFSKIAEDLESMRKKLEPLTNMFGKN